MTDDEFDNQYAALLNELTIFVQFLRRYGEKSWSATLENVKNGISETDTRSLKALLEMCRGGMGTLNDLVIHPLNGHSIAMMELDQVNSELKALISRVSDLADSLCRELSI